MAYCTVDDPSGNVEIIVFPDLYKASMTILQKDEKVLVKGTVDKTEKGLKIVSSDITLMDMLATKIGQKAEISLKLPLNEGVNLQSLKSILLSNGKGRYPLYLRVFHKKTETLITTGLKISDDRDIIGKIEEIAGKGAVTFQ